MSNLIIRPVTLDDAEAFFALRLEALQTNPEAFGASYEDTLQNWTAESYTAARVPSEDSDNVIFCAEKAGEFVGMMGFVREKSAKTKHTGFIWGVFAKPSLRGQGIGKKLLNAIIDHARSCENLSMITLSVVTENQAAIALYEKMGFTIWGTQNDALRDSQKSYDMHYMSYRIE